MARHDSGRIVETVPAVAGVIFSIATAQQFLDGTFKLGAFDYTMAPEHSFAISLAALIVVFASSKTKNWEYYESWEQVLVGVTILTITAHQFYEPFASAISNQNPYAGTFVFALGLICWGVLQR